MAIYIPWLVDAARAAVAGTGKQVIVSPGWETRGHGGMRVVEGVVGHHTATPESAPGDYPTLGVVRDGRAGLAGPLSCYGLGRSGNVYVIAAGLCYHAGASAYAGFVDLNDEFIGIEAEDSGDGVWNPEQLFMYPRLVRACLDYMHRGVDRYASHRTVAVPAGRKNDPWGISDDWMRQQAAAGSTPAPTSTSTFMEEEEMGTYYARGDAVIPGVGQPVYAIFYSEKGVERRWVSGEEGALLAKVRPGGFAPPAIPQGMLNAIPKVVGSVDWAGDIVKDPYA